MADSSKRVYVETFDNGPGGWVGWWAGGHGPLKLPIVEGAMVSRSPWGVDFNHAPPGGGYMHLLYCLPTMPGATFPYGRIEPWAGVNRFVNDGYPLDFTNAKVTLRLRGDVDLKQTHFMLHAQADVAQGAGKPPIRTNWALTGQPIRITPQWSEQTVTLTPEESQWTCMGVRKEGADWDYGTAPIADVLRDLNVNIIFVLGMLEIVPDSYVPLTGGVDELRAGKDYPVDYTKLPSGEVWLDTVKIEFAR